MLTKNKIDVLKTILDDNEELIIDLAKVNNIANPNASIGVARFLVADPNNILIMSTNQKYHYQNAIAPLINDVRCEGIIGERASCRGNGFIDEESLLWAYRDQDMRCQECIGEEERWFTSNP